MRIKVTHEWRDGRCTVTARDHDDMDFRSLFQWPTNDGRQNIGARMAKVLTTITLPGKPGRREREAAKKNLKTAMQIKYGVEK